MFGFLNREKTELCIFPEGLKWRNSRGNGIVKKFAIWQFEHKRKLGLLNNNRKDLKEWFGKWRENGSYIEIPIK